MIPRVYGAISAVAAALSKGGIAKARLNARDDYLYRSIDDVLARMAPLLAEHRLCILARVIERTAIDRIGEAGELLVSVTVRCAFSIVSAEDGSTHIIEAYGEALDAGDKGTAKAMQSAYKYAVLQAFCVPSAMTEDADARSHRLSSRHATPEPEEGWSEWGRTLEEALAGCATLEEPASLQDHRRPLLTSLARERPDLYKRVGEAITSKRAALMTAMASDSSLVSAPRKRAKPARTVRASELNGSAAHA